MYVYACISLSLSLSIYIYIYSFRRWHEATRDNNSKFKFTPQG